MRHETAKPGRGGGPRRAVRARLCGVLALLAVGATLLAGALVGTGNTGGEVDRAYARSVLAMTAAVGRAMGSVLGQGTDAGLFGWRGLRVYEPGLNAWRPLDAGAGARGPGDRIVLLVHGLDEPGGIWDQLAPALAGGGHTVVRFDYANDQSIAASADQLQAALEELRSHGVGRVDLVCHSMGGLVAWDVLTRPQGEHARPGADHLITLGTPFGGSPWARLRALAEAREQVQRWAESDDMDPARLAGFIRDGVGQAGVDLLPGSACLRALAERSPPPGLAITCVVGRATPDPSHAALARLVTERTLGDLLGRDDARVIRDELERLGDELGDGVVPIASATLPGVDDVVFVHANHRAMVRNIELGEAIRSMNGLPAAPTPPAIEIVLDRLRRR